MGHSEAFLKIVNDAKTKIRELTIDEVSQQRNQGESFALVDCREDLEWQAARIPQSVHIGKGVIERDIEKKIPNREEKIVIYCGGGFRSAIAAESLQKMGYTNVYSMDGGFRGWKEKGLPIDNG